MCCIHLSLCFCVMMRVSCHSADVARRCCCDPISPSLHKITNFQNKSFLQVSTFEHPRKFVFIKDQFDNYVIFWFWLWFLAPERVKGEALLVRSVMTEGLSRVQRVYLFNVRPCPYLTEVWLSVSQWFSVICWQCTCGFQWWGLIVSDNIRPMFLNFYCFTVYEISFFYKQNRTRQGKY